MNKTILQKCVEELKKDTPDISRVLGILETLIDMSMTQNSQSLPAFNHTDEVQTISPLTTVGPLGHLNS